VVVPIARRVTGTSWLGCMAGTVEVVGCEIAPTLASNSWNALTSGRIRRGQRHS
jgi:hypothetical protein